MTRGGWWDAHREALSTRATAPTSELSVDAGRGHVAAHLNQSGRRPCSSHRRLVPTTGTVREEHGGYG